MLTMMTLAGLLFAGVVCVVAVVTALALTKLTIQLVLIPLKLLVVPFIAVALIVKVAIALTALSARPERRELFDRAKAKLPRDLKHLALMQRVSVEDVPQVKDPRENLVGDEKGFPAAPAIADGGKPNDIAVQPIPGAPRAGRS